MRHAWLVLSFAACWHSSPPSAQTPGPPSTADTLPPPSAPLEGRLQIEHSGMCGGEKPPPDYRPPSLAPAPNVTLNVTAGGTYDGSPPLLQLTTAANGMFSAKLPAGTYCITFPRGPKPTQARRFTDLDCLVTGWATCEAAVEVPVKKVSAIDYYEPCSWSVCYDGPPPP